MLAVSAFVDTAPDTASQATTERPKRVHTCMQVGHSMLKVLPDYYLVTVAERCAVTVSDLVGSRRVAEVAMARHLVCWLMRLDGYSTCSIGRKLGGRDHTTVLNSLRRVQDAIDTGELLEGDLLEMHQDVRRRAGR